MSTAATTAFRTTRPTMSNHDNNALPELSEEDRAFSDAFEKWREQYRELKRLGLIEEPESTELERAPETRH